MNPKRHEGLEWSAVEAALSATPAKLTVLAAMEASGGEPDVIAFDKKIGEFLFCDRR